MLLFISCLAQTQVEGMLQNSSQPADTRPHSPVADTMLTCEHGNITHTHTKHQYVSTAVVGLVSRLAVP